MVNRTKTGIGSMYKKEGQQQHARPHLKVFGWPLRRLRKHWLKAIIVFAALLISLDNLLPGSNLSSDEQRVWQAKKVLLVTAHPDDEVMFFAPTVLELGRIGVNISALCLSVGDADNLGSIRKGELVDSYAMLGVPQHQVQSIDDEKLKDGMATRWDKEVIIDHILQRSKIDGPFDAIITFDERGVSLHPNHIACFQAVLRLSQASTLPTQFYVLKTISVYFKFLSLPMALAQRLRFAQYPQHIRILSSLRNYIRSIRAMRAHPSQLVWFRYLYITTSAYMYNNDLLRL